VGINFRRRKIVQALLARDSDQFGVDSCLLMFLVIAVPSYQQGKPVLCRGSVLMMAYLFSLNYVERNQLFDNLAACSKINQTISD